MSGETYQRDRGDGTIHSGSGKRGFMSLCGEAKTRRDAVYVEDGKTAQE